MRSSAPAGPFDAGQNPQQSDGTIPKFSSTSNLVIVDVTVKDKSGKPIENLKPTISSSLEDGKPQKISVFEYQKLTNMPEPPPPLTLSDQTKLPEAPKTTITAETPGQIQYHDKRLWSSSSISLPWESPSNCAPRMPRSIISTTKITKDDMVAIMLYTSRINVLTDFTGDRDLLTGIIKGLPIGEMRELAGLADDAATIIARTPARRSSPTRPSSISSTPTRSCSGHRAGLQACWLRFRKRKRSSTFRRREQDRRG